jgi:hypothetical protein
MSYLAGCIDNFYILWFCTDDGSTNANKIQYNTILDRKTSVFKYSHIWCCVTGWVVPDVSEELGAFISTAKFFEKSGTNHSMTQRHILEDFTLSNTTVRISHLTWGLYTSILKLLIYIMCIICYVKLKYFFCIIH